MAKMLLRGSDFALKQIEGTPGGQRFEVHKFLGASHHVLESRIADLLHGDDLGEDDTSAEKEITFHGNSACSLCGF